MLGPRGKRMDALMGPTYVLYTHVYLLDWVGVVITFILFEGSPDSLVQKTWKQRALIMKFRI